MPLATERPFTRVDEAGSDMRAWAGTCTGSADVLACATSDEPVVGVGAGDGTELVSRIQSNPMPAMPAKPSARKRRALGLRVRAACAVGWLAGGEGGELDVFVD